MTSCAILKTVRIVLVICILLVMQMASPLEHIATANQPAETKQQASQNLRQVMQELEAARDYVNRSRSALEASQRNLKADEVNVVALATLIQAQDQEIDILQKSILELGRQQLGYEAILAKRRQTGGAALTALTLLARTPPSAYFLGPKTPHAHARIGALLRAIGPTLAKESSTLYGIISELSYTRIESLKQRKAAELLKEEQQLRMASLQRAIRLKRSEIAAAEQDLRRQQRRQDNLLRQSKDLQDLIAAIEREARAEETRLRVEARKNPNSAKAQDDTQEKPQEIEQDSQPVETAGLAVQEALPLRRFQGGLVIPVVGDVFRNFGEETVEGNKSPGLAIRTVAGRLVTAPADGIVEFADNFRSYGGTVILRTSNSLRLLVFGLGEISVSKGEQVREGQQIGLSARVLEPVIYLEAWRKNIPVNPKTAKVSSSVRG